MSAVLFFIAAIGALTGAIGVVLLRNPFYSVLALVGHLISLAALFLLLEAQFVAAAQVVVYRRRRGLEEEEQIEPGPPVRRPIYTGTLAEAAGLRPGTGTGEGEIEDHADRETVTPEPTTSEGGW